MSNSVRIMKHFAVNLTAAGTAQAISAGETPTSIEVTKVRITAPAANTGSIYIGDSSVSSTNSFAELLGAGGKDAVVIIDAKEFSGDAVINLDSIFFDGGTSNDDIFVGYLT